VYVSRQECNAEVFTIVGWPAVWKCAAEIRAWCCCNSAAHDTKSSKHLALDLSAESMQSEAWSVTVMITAKGSVIIRLAWRNSITWSEQVSRQTLNACNVACFVVENCC
jgi:hypothetical protein